MRKLIIFAFSMMFVLQLFTIQSIPSIEAAPSDYVLDSPNPNGIAIGGLGVSRGVAIETSETFDVTQLGVDLDIVAKRTLTVEIHTVNGTTIGPTVASASTFIATTGVMTTHYVPINYTFEPGTRYLINFSGWDDAADNWNYEVYDNPTLDPASGYIIDPFTILDGNFELSNDWGTGAGVPIITITGEIVTVDPIVIVPGGIEAKQPINVPNIGEVLIETGNAQPVYDSAGGNIIKLNGSNLILPYDYDGNGFDTYTVAETVELDGRTWVAIWLGSENFGWLPLDAVTISRAIK